MRHHAEFIAVDHLGSLFRDPGCHHTKEKRLWTEWPHATRCRRHHSGVMFRSFTFI